MPGMDIDTPGEEVAGMDVPDPSASDTEDDQDDGGEEEYVFEHPNMYDMATPDEQVDNELVLVSVELELDKTTQKMKESRSHNKLGGSTPWIDPESLPPVKAGRIKIQKHVYHGLPGVEKWQAQYPGFRSKSYTHADAYSKIQKYLWTAHIMALKLDGKDLGCENKFPHKSSAPGRRDMYIRTTKGLEGLTSTCRTFPLAFRRNPRRPRVWALLQLPRSHLQIDFF